MPKIKPTKNTLLPIKYNGNRVVESSFSGAFTKEEIRKYAQFQSNKFKQEGKKGRISVALNYPGNNWRSGYITEFGDNISLYSLGDSGDDIVEEPKNFDEFKFYIMKI